jgi:capsular exopolysaccharide synthesis family protein
MEHKEISEMSGSTERQRVPVLRDAGAALDSIPLAALAAAAPPPPPAEQSDWQRYVTAVVRHKWLVIGVTVAGTLAGIVATRFLDPRYSAKTILWVETAVGRERGVQTNDNGPVLDSRGWVELVTSNTVLDTVVKTRRLFLHPETKADSSALTTFQITERVIPGTYRLVIDKAGRALRLEMEDGTVVQRGRVGQPVGETVGFDWTPTSDALKPGATISFRVSAVPDASAALASDLKARLDPAGNFLRLQLKGASAAGTAATLNAIAARIVDVETDMKRQKFQVLASVLGEQYTHAQQSLSEAEEALRDFRVRTAGAPMFGQTPGGGIAVEGGGAVTQLRNDVDQLNRDRRALDQAASQAAANGVSVEQWTGIAAVQYSPALQLALQDVTKKQSDLRTLRYQYTVDAAPVKQVQSELEMLERQVIPSLARQLSQELAARAARTAPRADTAVRVLRAAPNMAMEQQRLLREQQMAEEQFTTVGRQYDAAKLGVVSSLPDVRVLDPAVEPRRPASDYGPLLILLATMASFGLVVAGVTIRDRMDPKIRYPEQITGQMRLQILGAVPHVSWRVSANGDGPAQVIEALRGLRLRVLHAHQGGGPLALTVTSPGIGDGKSFVSLNLALSFADAGYRTLLVDGDTRRGVQHKALKTPSTPGLTDVVAGRVPLEVALRETSYPGLTFLSSGTRMQRAPERLLSQSMRDLMARLKSQFDVVIVDSPPLGAGADPLVLGTLTENLLLVLRTGQSDMNLANTKLEVLNSLPVRVIGAVLNDVRSSGVYRYYMYSSAEYELVDEEGPTREALPSVLGGRS